jgi:hypothetical protein
MAEPIVATLEKWELEAQMLADRLKNIEAAALCRAHIEDLRSTLDSLAQFPVPYRLASELTGFPLGSLKNMRTLNNIGGRSDPAFALGDLPFKAGLASPARLILAYRTLGTG